MTRAEIRVAILEDQRLTLETLERLLTANGLSVVLAATRADVFVGGLEEAKPNLALIELHPGEGHPAAVDPSVGLNIIRALKERYPEVSVIALSGAGSEEELNAAETAGASRALDKNVIGPDQLLAAVRATLRAQSADQTPAPGEQFPISDASRLTHRELQVLRHLATGADNLKIAALLGITERTVRAHVSALYRKLQCENRTEMAVLARTLGIRFSELES